MNKQELLDGVRELAGRNEITSQELLSAFDTARVPGQNEGDMMHTRLNVSNILYYIGGMIVLAGIVILLSINWQNLNSAARILSSLGAAIVLYISAALFYSKENYGGLARALFFVSMMILPVGLIITADQMGSQLGSGVQTAIALACFLAALASYYSFKTIIFAIFEIIFGSWFYFALLNLLIGNLAYPSFNITEYEVLVLGVSYVLLGEYFKETNRGGLTNMLQGAGIIMVLGSVMALGGYGSTASMFWEILLPFLIFGVIFASTFLRSKVFLVLGALFLMGDIFKTTAEYFSQGLGWPVALVLCGLLIIGVGQFTVYVNKKYIKAV